MFKKITIMLILALLVTTVWARDYGITYHEIQIVDELGRSVTDITNLYIYGPDTTTDAVIYMDRDRQNTITIPMTEASANTTLVDGYCYWWGPDGYDFSVSNDDAVGPLTNSGHEPRTGTEGALVFPSYLQSMSTTAWLDAQSISMGTGAEWVINGGGVADTLSITPAADNSSILIGANGAAYNTDFTVFVNTDLGLYIDVGVPSLIWNGGDCSINPNVAGTTNINTGTATGAVNIGSATAGIITVDTTESIGINADIGITVTNTTAANDQIFTTAGNFQIVASEDASLTAVNIDITGAVSGFDLDTTNGPIVMSAADATNGDVTIEAGDVYTMTSVDYKMFDGAATEVWRIDGTAAGSYHSISFTDATANIVWTFPDGATDTLAVMGSTLATNYPDIANSVTGGTNQLIFEGASVDTEETIIQATDPTADIIWILADGGADSLSVMGSTLTTNYPEIANSIWGASNELVFEGATGANAHELHLTVDDPTADNTITLPDDSGDIVFAPAGAVDYSAGAGALPTTHVQITYESSGGAEALTMGDGVPGQIIQVNHDTDGGNGVLTPDTATGYTSIDLADDGDSVTFMWVDTVGWIIIGTAGNAAPPVVTP